MLRSPNGIAFVTLAALLVAAPAAQGQADIRVLAEYEPGTFLENLEVQPDGQLLVTNYFAKTIERIGADGGSHTFTSLSAHPASLLRVPSGFVVAAHGSAFTSGPDFTRTQKILLLDEAGVETNAIELPAARFLNGMVKLPTGAVLIADSIAGTIWHLDPEASRVTPWLADARLAQDPQASAFMPGANGLKIDGDRLLVSNSSRGTLSAIPLDSETGAAAGPPTVLAETGSIDDFAVLSGGEVVFTTHGDSLKLLAPDGSLSTILPRGCDGCTAVAAKEDALIVLTTGDLFHGGGKPARVISLPLPR